MLGPANLPPIRQQQQVINRYQPQFASLQERKQKPFERPLTPQAPWYNPAGDQISFTGITEPAASRKLDMNSFMAALFGNENVKKAQALLKYFSQFISPEVQGQEAAKRLDQQA